jgi:hypothetical protein
MDKEKRNVFFIFTLVIIMPLAVNFESLRLFALIVLYIIILIMASMIADLEKKLDH